MFWFFFSLYSVLQPFPVQAIEDANLNDPGVETDVACTFLDNSSFREICLYKDSSRGDGQFMCERVCSNNQQTYSNCRFSSGRDNPCGSFQRTNEDATLYSPAYGGYSVFKSEVKKDKQCADQIGKQKPECAGALLGDFFDIGDPTLREECKQLANACMSGAQGANTPADCNQILAAEAHADCANLPEELEPNQSGETRQLCVQRKHAECIANCPTCGNAGGGDPVRKKPANYQGPIPDCAFTYNGCRSVNDLLELLVNIAKFLFGVIGSLALIFFVYGGITIILSFGNADKVKKGRDILVAAVVGIVISFSAYLLISFLIQALGVSTEFDFRKVERDAPPLVFALTMPTAVHAADTVNLINPIGGTADNPQGISRLDPKDEAQKPFVELIARIILSALGLIGSLTLLVFIYGGFIWLTSAGSADKVKKGWSAMSYAAIGLFIIFGAYAILSTVIRGLTA